MFGRILLRAIAFSTALSGAVGPLAAYGQSELMPLQQYLDLPDDRRVPTYPIIRCAGMYLGLLKYGIANLAPDKGRAGEKTGHVLSFVATIIRVRNNEGTVDEIYQNVMGSVNRISSLYVERLKDNYARVGQAFGADPLVKSDIELCKVIAQGVVERYPDAVKAVNDRFKELDAR